MGVGEGKYAVFSEFKKRVLNIAVKETNSYSSITVNPEVQKANKSVISIRFLIARKIKDTKQEICNDSDNLIVAQHNNRQLVCNKLKNEFGMSDHQIANVISKYDDQYISSKIQLIYASPSFLNGTIKNLAKYLLGALEKDYQAPKSSKEIVIKNNMKLYKEQEKKNLQERLVNQYDKYVRLQILENFDALEKEQKDTILEEFLNSNNVEPEVVDLYQQRGFSNGYVTSKFASFVREQKTELLNNILSFEHYCSKDDKKMT
jgi:hypothetical protein